MPPLLLEALTNDSEEELYSIGIRVGRFYTDHGLPIDIALDHLIYPKEQKLAVLNGALHWLVLHKRNSGATEKSINRQRKLNRQYLDRFLSGKDIGAY